MVRDFILVRILKVVLVPFVAQVKSSENGLFYHHSRL